MPLIRNGAAATPINIDNSKMFKESSYNMRETQNYITAALKREEESFELLPLALPQRVLMRNSSTEKRDNS